MHVYERVSVFVCVRFSTQHQQRCEYETVRMVNATVTVIMKRANFKLC